jgi:hypothetical protein
VNRVALKTEANETGWRNKTLWIITVEHEKNTRFVCTSNSFVRFLSYQGCEYRGHSLPGM